MPTPLAGGDRRHLILDLSEEERLYLEGMGVPALGGSPGGRFVASETFKAYRSVAPSGGYSPESCFVQVASASELPAMAAVVELQSHTITRSDLDAILPRATPLDFVTTVEATGRDVEGVDLTGVEVDGWGLPAGVASPEVVQVATAPREELTRWSGHAGVFRGALMDDEAVRRLVDAELVRHWFRSLGFEILTGDGSVTGTRIQLEGVANVAGTNSVAVAAGTRTSALLEAIRLIQDAGHPGLHVAVLAPVDAKALLEEPEWRRDRFPSLRDVVAFDKIAAGTGFVGQVGAGARLFSSGLAIEIAVDDTTDFLSGRVVVQAVGFVHLDIHRPAAFTVITGL